LENQKNAVADIVGLQKDEYTLTNGIITFGLIPEAEFVQVKQPQFALLLFHDYRII